MKKPYLPILILLGITGISALFTDIYAAENYNISDAYFSGSSLVIEWNLPFFWDLVNGDCSKDWDLAAMERSNWAKIYPIIPSCLNPNSASFSKEIKLISSVSDKNPEETNTIVVRWEYPAFNDSQPQIKSIAFSWQDLIIEGINLWFNRDHIIWNTCLIWPSWDSFGENQITLANRKECLPNSEWDKFIELWWNTKNYYVVKRNYKIGYTNLLIWQTSNSDQKINWQTNTTSNCTVNGQSVDCAEIAKTAGEVIKTWLWILLGLGILGFVLGIFSLIMLIHALSNPVPNKALWALFIFFIFPIWAIVYYFVIKKKYTTVLVPNIPQSIQVSQPIQVVQPEIWVLPLQHLHLCPCQ